MGPTRKEHWLSLLLPRVEAAPYHPQWTTTATMHSFTGSSTKHREMLGSAQTRKIYRLVLHWEWYRMVSQSTLPLAYTPLQVTPPPLGLAAHTGAPEFRVFPFENANLEPFEAAVSALNPVVAVKVRSAAVHAALGEAWVSFSCLGLEHCILDRFAPAILSGGLILLHGDGLEDPRLWRWRNTDEWGPILMCKFGCDSCTRGKSGFRYLVKRW